ncbi:MAG: LamG domain-containing protein [Candidatus Sericytochromatia bacterium]
MQKISSLLVLLAIFTVLSACSGLTPAINDALTSRPSPQPTTLRVDVDASLATASACNTALSNGLVAHYPLDGNGQDSVANAHGNLKGTTPPQATADRKGQAGKALLFKPEQENYVDLPLLNITPTNRPQLSISAWVRSDNNVTERLQQIVSNDDGDYDRSFGIDNRGGGFGWSAFMGTEGVLGFDPIRKGEWTFVVVSYDNVAGGVQLFVNGKQFAKKPTTVGEGLAAARIGSNPTFGEYFEGAIDEVRVYSRSVDSQTVKQWQACSQ